MFSLLFWNVRGANNKALRRHIKSVCNGPKPSLVILVETKSSDESPFKPLASLGFDSMKSIPSVGFFGGMVMLWRSSSINVSIIEENRQFFLVLCELPDHSRFLLTSVYAIPHSNLRSVLWSKLKGMAAAINQPWLVIGDFNDILTSSERSGGAREKFGWDLGRGKRLEVEEGDGKQYDTLKEEEKREK
ncbi:hypothetical protein K1719_000547 [Acacia pycnantha]|nr:hypothetical protein K1719_000547 [Acacia pycnantha]